MFHVVKHNFAVVQALGKEAVLAKTIKARIPVQRRGIESKAKVVEAAKALFIEKGYYKTHALEIAARAGVATGTFYSYFNDKKEVLIELMRQFYRQGRELALSELDEDLLNAGDWKRLIHNLIQSMLSLHVSQRDLHRTLHPMVFMDRDAFEIYRQEERAIIHLIADYFDRYKDMLRVADTLAAAEITYKACDEVVHRIIFWGPESDDKQLVLELEDMLYRYLIDHQT